MPDHSLFKKTLGLISAAGVACGVATAHAAAVPAPLHDEPAVQTSGMQTAAGGGMQTIVVAGGCFWGVEAVFRHLKGVVSAVSGYAGGSVEQPRYDAVSGGATGHAESVQVTYNPAEISAGKILRVFFAVAHDPTEVNRQGPDSGTQYRSAVFFTTPEQEKVAKDYIVQLDAAKVFSRPIATEVKPLQKFWPAESYHQDYVRQHPEQPYIVYNDLPKVASLKKTFPDLYVEAK